MSSREVTLGEVCEIKQGKYLSPGQMEAQPTEEAFVPVVGGNGILGYTTKSTFTFPLPLVTCRGSKCGLMQWAEPPTWISNNAMAVYFKGGFGDNFFLYQYLLQSDFDDVTTGSAQPQITVSSLALKKILLPALREQRAIAQIMGAIEEKIQVNQKLSKTLEQIAQSIFQSWFVDFDPVKAKMAGEKPVGMDDVTAALFPDSMEETDNGLIPKGWKYSLIENFAHVRYGAPFASKLFNDIGDGMPLIRIRDLKSQRIAIWSAENHTKGFTVNGGQLLIGMDGEFNPTLWRGEEALVNQRICLLENRPGVSSLFLYFSLIPIMKRIENGAIGTTVIHLGKGDIDEICLLNPGTELLNIFEGLMKELLQEMVSLDGQSRNLLAIRDSLLPRLISGELQIPKEMLPS